MIFLARLPSLALSLALAVCLALWAKRWFGDWGLVLALACYVFEPNILAHSGLANMDLALTTFLFTAYFFLVEYLEEPKPWWLWAGGVLAGCALATKLPGLFFFAWSAGLVLLWRKHLSPTLKINAALFAMAAAVLLLAYQIRYIPQFFGLLGQMLPAMFGHHPTEQHFNFFHGVLKQGGWWHYYWVALAVKASIPFLLLSALGFFAMTGKERLILGWPVLSYIAICTVASKQNGLRYILPIFPFLCLAAGGLARKKSYSWILALGLLMGWSVFEAVRFAPNYLAYFNQFAGGPQNGYRWLVDSNLDWGQDFPRLKRLLIYEGRPETIVATLGNADRDYYFGAHQDLLAWNQAPGEPVHLNSAAPKRELLIVSASFLQGFGLTDPQAFAWLRTIKPLAQPGFSSFVYDVTFDALSQFNIGKIYLRNKQHAAARRQFERAAALAPERPEPRRALRDLGVKASSARGL
ncbi:MAG: phospholipid carrier-dependent glycosyltransferase [Elusimicrobiota bacterium]